MAEVPVRAILEADDRASAALGAASGSFSSLTTKMTLAAGSATAFALASGNAADKAKQAIVQGTGASGAALASLEQSWKDMAGTVAGASLQDTSAAIADLNTHLGLFDAELELVATAALQAGVNTDKFGRTAKVMGLDAQGATTLLDQLKTVEQETGVSANDMIAVFERQSARFQGLGVDSQTLMDYVTQLAQDGMGPQGLRGALSELAQEIEQGANPSVVTLAARVGDVSGAVANSHVPTFTEEIAALKDRAMAAISPFGNVAGAIGSVGTAIIPLAPMLPALAGGFRILWAAITGPVGLVVGAITAVGAGIYAFRGQIGDVLSSIIPVVAQFASSLIEKFRGVAEFADEWIGTNFSESLNRARAAVEDTGADLAEWTDSWGEVPPAVEGATVSVDDLSAAARGAEEALGGGAEGMIGGIYETAAAADEAEPRIKAFWKTVSEGPLHVEPSRDAMSVWSNRLVRVNEPAAVAAGERYWEAVEAGFIGGVEQAPVGTVIENLAGGIDHAPFEESGLDTGGAWKEGFDSVVSADNIFGSIARAFEGGGGWMGGIKSIGAQIGGSLIEGLQGGSLGKLPGVFGKIGGKVQALWGKVSGLVSAIPFAGPILAAFGPQILKGLGAIGKKVWGAIKGWFGPSEAEIEGRKMFEAFRTGAEVPLEHLEEYNRQVAEAVDAGWDRSLAEVRAKFVTMGMAAGLSHDQAFDAYSRYQKAVGDGNTELMRQLEAQYGEWLKTVQGTAEEAAAAVEGSTEEIVHSAEEIGRQFKGLTADEAKELGAALENLGAKANLGFTAIHSAALAVGNALANVTLPALKSVRQELEKAASAAGRLGSRMRSIPSAPGGGDGAPEAHEGGVFSGPASGYNVRLHGTETVVPGSHPQLVSSGGGGVSVTINVSGADVLDARRFGDRAFREFMRGMRRGGVR